MRLFIRTYTQPLPGGDEVVLDIEITEHSAYGVYRLRGDDGVALAGYIDKDLRPRPLDFNTNSEEVLQTVIMLCAHARHDYLLVTKASGPLSYLQSRPRLGISLLLLLCIIVAAVAYGLGEMSANPLCLV